VHVGLGDGPLRHGRLWRRGVSAPNVVLDQLDAIEVPVIWKSPAAHSHGDIVEVDCVGKGRPGIIAAG